MPAGRAAACGAPTATVRRGSPRTAWAAVRAPCTSRCARTRWRTDPQRSLRSPPRSRGRVREASDYHRPVPQAPGDVFRQAWCYPRPPDEIWEDSVSRKLLVALAAALIGFGASAPAESSVKSSKSNISEKAKRGGQGQSAKPTIVRNGSNVGGRADCEY